jgi:hypothetical protein
MAVSDPNAIERKTKAVAGWSPIRVQIMESAFRELSSDGGAVIAVRETRTDAASVWTSIGRIQRLPSRRTVTRAGAYNSSRANIVPDRMRARIAKHRRLPSDIERAIIPPIPPGISRSTDSHGPLSQAARRSRRAQHQEFASSRAKRRSRLALPGLIAYYYILRCFTSNWRSSSR